MRATGMTRDNFSISEMTECSFAERLGIDNTPDLAILETLGRTVTGLEKVRALLGYPVHVNSGFRCEAWERVLSAKDFGAWCVAMQLPSDDAAWRLYFADKSHSKGFAADVTCAQFGSPGEVQAAIAASDIAFDQCILEGSWVHISFDPRMRRQLLRKRFDRSGVARSEPLASGA